MGTSTMPNSGLEEELMEAMSDMSLDTSAVHDAGATGIHSKRRSSDTGNDCGADDAGAVGVASLGNLRQSSGPGDNYEVFPVSLTDYLDVIHWKVSQRFNPVFNSNLEKEAIQRGRDQTEVRHSPFWLHPVRYEPSISEPNTLRTVHIDHIPKHCSMQELLLELCWGAVESIQLVDVGNLKGPQGPMPAPYKFARIVYVKEKYAIKFQDWAHNKPLTIAGEPVRVYLQMEPTYPRMAEVDEAIFELKMTRILSVFGLTSRATEQLPAFLKTRGLDLVSLEVRPHDFEEDENARTENKTMMEFRSILHAFRALNAMRDGGYEGARSFMIEPDYCAREA